MASVNTVPSTSATPVVKKRLIPVKTKIRIKQEDIRQCRLCMRVVHRNNTRDTIARGYDFRRKILEAVSVKITSKDMLQAVCTNCAMVVSMINDFRMSCRNADMMHQNKKRVMLHSDNWLSDENKHTLEVCHRMLKRNRAEIDELFRISGLDKWNLHQLTEDVEVEKIKPEPKNEPISSDEPKTSTEEPTTKDDPMIPFERIDLVTSTEEVVNKTEEIVDSDPEMSEQCGRELDEEADQKAEPKVVIRSEARPQMCDTCGQFVTKKRLEQHLNKHLGIRPYVCPEKNCNKRFYSNVVKKNHIANIHVREKQRFECETCHKSIQGLEYYQRHLKVHQEDNPLKVPCEVCGKKFYRRYINDHMFIHTGDLPYQCTFCDRKFAAKNNWQVHIRKQHPDMLTDHA